MPNDTQTPEKRLWFNAATVKFYERADGKARLFIQRRDDGLFQFQEEHEHIERGGPHDGEVYWVPVQTSGFYDNLDSAENEAAASVTWLNECRSSA